MKVNNCGAWTKCYGLNDASNIIRLRIDRDGMGSTEWHQFKDNGLVTDDAGETVAQISYNGRIWTTPFDIAWAQGKARKTQQA